MEGNSETRDLARILLAYEVNSAGDSDASECAALRVYEKLRGNLCTLIGVAGFESLASRALALASSRVPGLGLLQIAPDGNLQRICDSALSIEADEHLIGQGGVIFISTLLELLLMFLGKALTMNLVRNVWPDAAFPRSVRETGENCEHR